MFDVYAHVCQGKKTDPPTSRFMAMNALTEVILLQ